jgi:hypothetical protein
MRRSRPRAAAPDPNPPDPVTIDTPLNANGIARINIYYEDQIRFCAPHLALGAAIEVYARMLHPASVASVDVDSNDIDKASSIMTATLGGAEHCDGSYHHGIEGGGTFVLVDRSEKGVVLGDHPTSSPPHPRFPMSISSMSPGTSRGASAPRPMRPSRALLAR